MRTSPNKQWLLAHTGSRGVAENMAIDEFLLRYGAERGLPILRFYSWTEPGATFGYSQHFSEVSDLTEFTPLVRRPTGGGLVPHLDDWTYSCVFPPVDPWYSLKAPASYQRIHQWLADAFALVGVRSELAAQQLDDGRGQCFIGAEVSDLLAEGKKFAGAAQRRTREGLLIQGSIQPPPPGVAKADWQKALCDVAHREWDVNWVSLELDPLMEEAIQNLTRGKYGTDEYNRKR